MPNARIAAIAAAAPRAFVDTGHFAKIFGAEESARIEKATGVVRRPRLPLDVTPIELALVAARSAIEHSGVSAATIDGLIYVTQCPEFVVPASACLLQNRLELPNEAAAFDVNLSCSGYVYGLFLASSLVRSGARKRVLLVAGDVNSRVVDDRDRATAPLFGDAYGATIVEATDDADAFGPFRLGTDGGGWPHLVQPVGMRRFENVAEFERKRPPELANVRFPEKLYMNGEEVFSFTLNRVPPMVAGVLQDAGLTIDQVDSFVFHQANKFILEQLRRKSKIPPEKFLYSIEEFGNTSSATIPITICHKLAASEKKGVRALVAGFGAGLSWAATVLTFDGRCVAPVTRWG